MKHNWIEIDSFFCKCIICVEKSTYTWHDEIKIKAWLKLEIKGLFKKRIFFSCYEVVDLKKLFWLQTFYRYWITLCCDRFEEIVMFFGGKLLTFRVKSCLLSTLRDIPKKLPIKSYFLDQLDMIARYRL